MLFWMLILKDTIHRAKHGNKCFCVTVGITICNVYIHQRLLVASIRVFYYTSYAQELNGLVAFHGIIENSSLENSAELKKPCETCDIKPQEPELTTRV